MLRSSEDTSAASELDKEYGSISNDEVPSFLADDEYLTEDCSEGDSDTRCSEMVDSSVDSCKDVLSCC